MENNEKLDVFLKSYNVILNWCVEDLNICDEHTKSCIEILNLRDEALNSSLMR